MIDEIENPVESEMVAEAPAQEVTAQTEEAATETPAEEPQESKPRRKDPREELDLPLESIIEALLIAAPEPRTVKQLAASAGRKVKPAEVEEAIATLNQYYIETSRAFEAYQKVIQTVDEATAKSINEVGRTQ